MQVDINQVVTKAIEKAKENPQFTEDLMKYVQYITLRYCSQDRLPTLKQSLESGNMKDLLEFGTESVPNFNKQIVEYITNY